MTIDIIRKLDCGHTPVRCCSTAYTAPDHVYVCDVCMVLYSAYAVTVKVLCGRCRDSFCQFVRLKSLLIYSTAVHIASRWMEPATYDAPANDHSHSSIRAQRLTNRYA